MDPLLGIVATLVAVVCVALLGVTLMRTTGARPR